MSRTLLDPLTNGCSMGEGNHRRLRHFGRCAAKQTDSKPRLTFRSLGREEATTRRTFANGTLCRCYVGSDSLNYFQSFDNPLPKKRREGERVLR